jgi:hypothetical protein
MNLMTDARLTTGWRGCALAGRDSHPLDSFIVFQIGLTSFLPHDTTLLGRTPHNPLLRTFREKGKRLQAAAHA